MLGYKALLSSVAKKPFGDRTRVVRRGGVESGLLKMVIEGGVL